MFNIPYMLYLYRHDKAIVEENAHAMMRFLDYLTTAVCDDGLIHYGLG